MKWTIVAFLISFYQSLFYPFELAFISDGLQGGGFNAFYVIEIIIEIFFIIDLILSLRTTYADSNNEEVVESKTIAKHYIRQGSFAMDLIGVLPIPEIALIIARSNNYYFKLYYILRLYRVRRLMDLNSFISKESYLTLFSFIRMLLQFAILVNI